MSSDPRFAYRETAARAASPVGRVVLLYEQAIQDVGSAIAAIDHQDVETRTQKIGHALLVIGQLQGSLDLDRGGEVARNLDHFYAVLRKRLLEAQIASSTTILRQQMELLLSLRAAWIEVEKSEAQKQVPAPAAPVPQPGTAARTRWRA